MTTRAEVLDRFPLLEDLSRGKIRRFLQDLNTLRSCSLHDNREKRRQAVQTIVDRLGMSPGGTEWMAANLMIYQDGTSSRNTTHRDSHTPSRKRRRTASVAPLTPEPQQELFTGEDEGGIMLEDDTNDNPDEDTALPRQPLLPTPGGTPSRVPAAQTQANAGAEMNNLPIQGPSLSDAMALENGMLRAQLKDTQFELSGLQIALARRDSEAMAERERLRRLARDIRTRVDEED